MTTVKPKIVIYTEQETIDKLDILAKEHNRSRGNMADTIIKGYIEEYEKKNNIEINIGRDHNGNINL